jgi:hypothetical protein
LKYAVVIVSGAAHANIPTKAVGATGEGCCPSPSKEPHSGE